MAKALVDQTSEILNLSNFDLKGMTLKVNNLQVEAGKLTQQPKPMSSKSYLVGG